MDSLLYTFVQDLGLGELPILSEENRGLNEELAAKQLEVAKLKNLNGDERTTVDRIFGHWNSVKESGTSVTRAVRGHPERTSQVRWRGGVSPKGTK